MDINQLFSSVTLALLSIPATTTALKLNVTAIGAQNGLSTLECWQLDRPFDISDQPGTAGTAAAILGSAANLSYTVLPPNFDGGLHNAPYNQWVAFISGLAHITLPEDDDGPGAYISGGEFGLIFAADTAEVSRSGHRTRYPGVTETVALQIPIGDGEVPAHDLLHTGPCEANEVGGFRGTASASSAKF